MTRYEYDHDGNLVRTVTPLTTSSSRYDGADRLIETTDENGTLVAYDYDAANRVLSRTVDPGGDDRLNLTTSYSYDAKGQVITTTDPNDVVTSIEYDRAGQVLKRIVDPDGLRLATVYTYDATGAVLTVTDPANTLTRYTYDEFGRRIREQLDPDGLNLTTTYTYDDKNNAVARTDANGAVTRFAYDANDRLVCTVDPAGGVAFNEYDAEGRLSRTTRYASALTAAEMASLPMQASSEQVLALVEAMPGKDALDARTYDDDGRLLYSVDGTGAVVEYRYDRNGNAVERIAYATAIDLAAWQPGDLPAIVADPAHDQHVRTVFDALDRASYVADAVGAVTHYVYDGNGNIIRSVEHATPVVAADAPDSVAASAGDRVCVYAYDAANRQTWSVDGVGAVTRNEFDANGNVVLRTQFATPVAPGSVPDEDPEGPSRFVRMEYDAANRLVRTAMGGTDGDRGNNSNSSAVSSEYDGVGRVVKTTKHFDTTQQQDSPNDEVSTFTYDAAGRLATSTDAQGSSESFTYDGVGNKLTFTNKKGSVWHYTYDAAGRVLTETSPEVDLAGVRAVTSAGGAELLELDPSAVTHAAIVTAYAYDALGNLSSRTEAYGRPEQRTTSYEYDACGRQVKVVYPLLAIYGNESAEQLAANGQDGVAARTDVVGAAPVSQTFYDALGNAIANVDVRGNASYKLYDAAGRVAFDVDALGGVTGYERNAFGDTTVLTRYGAGIDLQDMALAPTTCVEAEAAARALAAKLADPTMGHAADRQLVNTYDAVGNLLTVTEPRATVYDRNFGTYITKSAAVTRHAYNAFGEAVKVGQLLDAQTDTWADTYLSLIHI